MNIKEIQIYVDDDLKKEFEEREFQEYCFRDKVMKTKNYQPDSKFINIDGKDMFCYLIDKNDQFYTFKPHII